MTNVAPDAVDVLHVDDEPDFAAMAATFLEREDERFTVETATSVADGLDRLDRNVDCILSDYDMPGQTGIEFLESVREEYPDLPFILFIGNDGGARFEIASVETPASATDD